MPNLFTGAVRDNKQYGKANATAAAIWHALEIAQARDFIVPNPVRLAYLLALRGGNFSGGQRQRLAIARALELHASIYVLAASFSALDFKTDANLRAA